MAKKKQKTEKTKTKNRKKLCAPEKQKKKEITKKKKKSYRIHHPLLFNPTKYIKIMNPYKKGGKNQQKLIRLPRGGRHQPNVSYPIPHLKNAEHETAKFQYH
jgi:hypothetical protein